VQVGLGRKFEPPSVMFSPAVPCVPLFGLTLANVGGGFKIPVVTLKPFTRVADCPSGLTTVMFLDPTEALYRTVMLAVSCVLETNEHEEILIPAPKSHDVPFTKFVPPRFTEILDCPWEPELGTEVDRVGAGVVVTVTVRTGGLGSVLPAESVTVREAVYSPAVENVTGPGLASVLVFGLPPRMDHEYAAIEPLGALPEPAKFTDCPGVMNTFETGLVMVPVGGVSFGVKESCTNFATEGTPELLIRNNM
jgi:hypothetical protein